VGIQDIKEEVLVLARDGFVLPLCPECGIVMFLEEEALVGHCRSCGADFTLDIVPWIMAELLPEA
jgi:hypothetical protein